MPSEGAVGQRQRGRSPKGIDIYDHRAVGSPLPGAGAGPVGGSAGAR
ncbi:hypothetical protein VB780_11565 [Leptolyngbya sp. CCNP1308]|nr:hypothetical protein [Leptolyngbya sp. CCNP1308]MEA5449210.1 hypothetical protein [Leptolyngbya sp. CCNP1308]